MGSNSDWRGEIAVAAWGSNVGEEWSYKSASGISQIKIKHGGYHIDSVMFKSANSSDRSTKFGGEGGDRTDKVNLDFPSEFLTGVSGTICTGRITSLDVKTNRREYSLFRSQCFESLHHDHQPFRFHAKDGVITGFHGRAGKFLNAIGVYVVPLSIHTTEVLKKEHSGIDSTVLSLRPSHWAAPSAGPWGSSGGRDWDDGVFSAVIGWNLRTRPCDKYGSVLTAAQFLYLRKDGSDFSSRFYGDSFDFVFCRGGDQMRTYYGKIEEGEFVVGIEGFYGSLENGNSVIRSLTLITNKAKYGPKGDEIGTYFTSMNFVDCNRKVVGFHGRSGAYLNAIGVHTEYLI